MAGNNSKGNILLVDDDLDIILTMKKGLQREGIEVDAFNSPAEALAQFKPNHYDAIVLDVRMPKMTPALNWPKTPMPKSASLQHLKFMREAKIAFKHFKTQCFIKKPVTPSALAEHISKHMLQISEKE